MISLCRSIGKNLGYCFQIRDDIFDYFNEAQIGKPTGNDMTEGKLTLPVIYALRTADDAEMNAIALKVKRGEVSKEEIARLVEFTKQNGGVDYARGVMEDYRRKALHCLESFKNEEINQALTRYVDFVIGRSL